MLVGAVLAGGASRRMGRPKALVPVDGVPMAARVATAMHGAGVARGAVALVGGPDGWAADLGLVAVADRWPGEGPLGATATALLDAPAAVGAPSSPASERADDVVVVVAACDQPWLTGPALARLVAALAARPDAVAALARGADGRRHPFPSAWRSSAAAVLDHLVAAGERRADAAHTRVVVVDVDLADEVVVDVDRPGDLPPVP